MRISKSQFFYIILILLGFVITIMGPLVLPPRFYYDSTTILTNPYNLQGIIGSFEFTMWFYRVTFLEKLPYFAIGIIQYGVACFLIHKIHPPQNYHKLTIKNIIIICLYIVLAIFMASPTKEFISFLYFSILVFIVLKKHKRKFLKATLWILLFGYFFRDYFIIVLLTSFSLYFLMQIKITNRRLLFFVYGISILLVTSIAFGLLKGKYITNYTREFVNSSRSTDNNSAIQSPLKTDTWYGESVGIVYGFVSVNYPFNAYLKLSPPILIFATFQLLLMFFLIRKLKIYVISDSDKFYKWFFYFCFSYFFVQGLFEPDLGSAIRHKIGVFPLIYFMLNYEFFKEKRGANI